MNTILIVEDEAIYIRLFTALLDRQAGLAVKHSENVEEVIEIAKSGQADAILMDVCLPNSRYRGQVIDGVHITKLLKSDPQSAKIPVILVTANEFVSDRGNLIEQSGADGYIAKPVTDYQQFIADVLAQLPSKRG
ncbi:MAG: response regulator [Cyanobacteriota bacterium]|nr:response regulator [Cyanobacteriota bacterium]